MARFQESGRCRGYALGWCTLLRRWGWSIGRDTHCGWGMKMDDNNILDDSDIPSLRLSDVEGVVTEAFRELFLDVFERRFCCKLTGEQEQRLAEAEPLAIRDWIVNCVDASNMEAVFVSTLEREIVRVAAHKLRRRFGSDAFDPNGRLVDIERALEQVATDDDPQLLVRRTGEP